MWRKAGNRRYDCLYKNDTLFTSFGFFKAFPEPKEVLAVAEPSPYHLGLVGPNPSPRVTAWMSPLRETSLTHSPN